MGDGGLHRPVIKERKRDMKKIVIGAGGGAAIGSVTGVGAGTGALIGGAGGAGIGALTTPNKR
jgi:hypothetical protein